MVDSGYDFVLLISSGFVFQKKNTDRKWPWPLFCLKPPFAAIIYFFFFEKEALASLELDKCVHVAQSIIMSMPLNLRASTAWRLNDRHVPLSTYSARYGTQVLRVLTKNYTNWAKSPALEKDLFNFKSVCRGSVDAVVLDGLLSEQHHPQSTQASLEEDEMLFPFWPNHQNWVRELDRSKRWPSGPVPVSMWLWLISRISKPRKCTVGFVHLSSECIPPEPHWVLLSKQHSLILDEG